MAERCRRLISPAHLRSLLPAVLLLVPALVVASIVVETLTGVDRPAGAARLEQGERAAGAAHRARTITIGWVGDVTPGSQYGLPGGGGAALFADVRGTLREPDLMAANLEGTLSQGGASKCGTGADNCFAFQAPPANARALRDAGIDL